MMGAVRAEAGGERAWSVQSVDYRLVWLGEWGTQVRDDPGEIRPPFRPREEGLLTPLPTPLPVPSDNAAGDGQTLQP